MTMMTPQHLSRLPIPHRIAGFALTATLFVLILLGLAHHNYRGEIVGGPSPSSPSSSLRSQSYIVEQPSPDEEESTSGAAVPAVAVPAAEKAGESYYVFLQKFPLENSWKMLFHTEVVVCPRSTFASDPTFLNVLDALVSTTLAPSRFSDILGEGDATKAPFTAIEKEQWSKQSKPGCVQLGYGGANCASGCCGSPHKANNRNYALSTKEAVIGNAMTDFKELFFYGISDSTGGGEGGISGDDAYKAVCHGHMNAIEMGGLPKCVSDWTGQNYNPVTNNCNTFTSTVLKCVYGLSDAKPHLGVSDMINVSCPSEKSGDGKDAQQCTVPTMDEAFQFSEMEMDSRSLD